MCRGHAKGILGVAVFPSGGKIVTGSTDKKAIVWDAMMTDQLIVWRGHKGKIQSLSILPDGDDVSSVTTTLLVPRWLRQRARLLSARWFCFTHCFDRAELSTGIAGTRGMLPPPGRLSGASTSLRPHSLEVGLPSTHRCLCTYRVGRGGSAAHQLEGGRVTFQRSHRTTVAPYHGRTVRRSHRTAVAPFSGLRP